MSSHTSLSDHRNSIPSAQSVIHSEPSLNILVGVYHTFLSCTLSCVRISEQDVWCWWLTSTGFR